MKRFLMCEPRYFDVCYVINPWMEGNQGRVNRTLAQRQWQGLHDIVAELAAVGLIAPVAGLPDMVFTANAGLVHGEDAIVSSFLHAERQPEAGHYERFFSSRGYRVHRLQQGSIFEGEGDALFDTRGRLWVGYGIRSDARAAEQILAILDVELYGLQLIDPRWYHLDTCFCPLPGGQAIAYAKAFTENSVTALSQTFGENILWVSDEDAKNFACNAICIGQTLILHKVSAELKTTLMQRGFEVIEMDVSEFLKSGGACKCLVLEI